MIIILSDAAVGGTFLTWSIHYLSGQSRYFLAQHNKWVDLPENPLTDRNAHGFDTSRPGNIEQCNNILTNTSAMTDYTYCQYFHPTARLSAESQDVVDILKSKANKTIVLTLHPYYKLYYVSYKRRGGPQISFFDPNIILTSDDDIHWDRIDYYYGQAKRDWGADNLINIWDHREFLALSASFRSTFPSILTFTDLQTDHYRLNSLDLWTMFEHNLESLFQYLEIEMCTDRYPLWLDVYNQWKKIHVNRIMFCNYFDIIIEYIVSGVNFDLEKFGLDIMQEAAIQHALMYRHNLNLKTWQIIKFTNTRQLHELLEPCLHDLSKNYFKDLSLASL